MSSTIIKGKYQRQDVNIALNNAKSNENNDNRMTSTKTKRK